MICPIRTSEEWNTLVDRVGYANAWVIFRKLNGVPTLKQIEQYKVGEKYPEFESVVVSDRLYSLSNIRVSVSQFALPEGLKSKQMVEGFYSFRQANSNNYINVNVSKLATYTLNDNTITDEHGNTFSVEEIATMLGYTNVENFKSSESYKRMNDGITYYEVLPIPNMETLPDTLIDVEGLKLYSYPTVAKVKEALNSAEINYNLNKMGDKLKQLRTLISEQVAKGKRSIHLTGNYDWKIKQGDYDVKAQGILDKLLSDETISKYKDKLTFIASGSVGFDQAFMKAAINAGLNVEIYSNKNTDRLDNYKAFNKVSDIVTNALELSDTRKPEIARQLLRYSVSTNKINLTKEQKARRLARKLEQLTGIKINFVNEQILIEKARELGFEINGFDLDSLKKQAAEVDKIIEDKFPDRGKTISNISNNVTFSESKITGYKDRTIQNASADATIALATDFNSFGELDTKVAVLGQNKKYIPIDANNLNVTPERVDKIVNTLNSITKTPKAKGKMTFAYKDNKRANIKSTTTFDAIKNGERTATTRYESDGHIDYWKNLKVGDIIEWESANGEKILVEVTKPLYKLSENNKSNLAEEWSKKEGWSVDYFNTKVKPKINEAWQIEYKTLNKSGVSLNIAGNGIYTMKGKYTQDQVDEFTYKLLKAIVESPNLKVKINSIRSGGQTGFDEAGAKAGIKLGIPTSIHAPKGWVFRNEEGKDIANEQLFKSRFPSTSIEDKQLNLFADPRIQHLIELLGTETYSRITNTIGEIPDFSNDENFKALVNAVGERIATIVFCANKVKPQGMVDTSYQLPNNIKEFKTAEKTIRDIAARMSARIGIDVKFEADRTKEYKGKVQYDTVFINLAYATLDTPIHEILGHPIIRAIKNRSNYYKEGETAEFHGYGDPERVTITKIFDDTLEAEFRDSKGNIQKADLFELTKTQNTLLYQNLLKELEYGRGKEVLDRIKRDYINKNQYNKEDFSIQEEEQFDIDEGKRIKRFTVLNSKNPYAAQTIFKNIEDAQKELEKLAATQPYTLEEQQEEAIVELLGLYTADRLDKIKDAGLITLLKQLLKSIKDFMKELIMQKEIEIDKLPDNMTIGDIADILAYSNSKLILPGYEVVYTTPDNQQFKTYQEASNHISQLAKSAEDVDLVDLAVNISIENIDKEIETLQKELDNFKFEIEPFNKFVDVYTNKGRLRQNYWARKKDGTTGWTGGAKETLLEPEYDGFVLDINRGDGRFITKISDEEAEKLYYAQENKFNTATEASREKYAELETKIHNLKNNSLKGFIEKNKEYEQAKEIIEEWIRINNIQYNPEEVYSRGQEFVSVLGAYSDFDVNLMMQNLLQHIEDNEKAGGKFTISAFTKPIDKVIRHLEGGGSKIKFKIYPQPEDILWAANADVYSGSVWDAAVKVSTKQSELTGVSYTKYPRLENIDRVQPNLAAIIDNIEYHHNELGINLTTNNFRIEYDDNIDYSTKKLIDNVNKILDDKYGKLEKPEVKVPESKKITKFKVKGELNIFNTREEAQALANKLSQIDYMSTYVVIPIQVDEIIGKQPTQTRENTTSIESVRDKIDDGTFGIKSLTARLKYEQNKIKILQANIDTNLNVEESKKAIEETKKEISRLEGLIKNPPQKEYTSQAETNLKIAALKEVARKYPRSLIRSEVYSLEREKDYVADDWKNIDWQKISNNDKINTLNKFDISINNTTEVAFKDEDNIPYYKANDSEIESYMSNHPDSFYNTLYKTITKYLKDANIDVRGYHFHMDETSQGRTVIFKENDKYFYRISLNQSYFNNINPEKLDEELGHTICHELLHALTYELYQTDPKFKKELDTYAQGLDYLGLNIRKFENGLELISEVFTNLDTASELSSRRSINTIKLVSSELGNLVVKAINKDNVDNTALAGAINTIVSTIKKSRKARSFNVQFDKLNSLNGLYYKGNAYINSDRITSETLLHEVTHPIVDVIEKNNKELFKSLLNEMINLPEWNLIAKEVALGYNGEKRDSYSLSDFNAEQTKELLTRYIARAANGYISQDNWGSTKEALNKFNDFVANLANGNLKDKINQGTPITAKDLANISLNGLSLLLGSLSVEFDTEYDNVMKDRVVDENLSYQVKKKEALKEIAKIVELTSEKLRKITMKELEADRKAKGLSLESFSVKDTVINTIKGNIVKLQTADTTENKKYLEFWEWMSNELTSNPELWMEAKAYLATTFGIDVNELAESEAESVKDYNKDATQIDTTQTLIDSIKRTLMRIEETEVRIVKTATGYEFAKDKNGSTVHTKYNPITGMVETIDVLKMVDFLKTYLCNALDEKHMIHMLERLGSSHNAMKRLVDQAKVDDGLRHALYTTFVQSKSADMAVNLVTLANGYYRADVKNLNQDRHLIIGKEWNNSVQDKFKYNQDAIDNCLAEIARPTINMAGALYNMQKVFSLLGINTSIEDINAVINNLSDKNDTDADRLNRIKNELVLPVNKMIETLAAMQEVSDPKEASKLSKTVLSICNNLAKEYGEFNYNYGANMYYNVEQSLCQGVRHGNFLSTEFKMFQVNDEYAAKELRKYLQTLSNIPEFQYSNLFNLLWDGQNKDRINYRLINDTIKFYLFNGITVNDTNGKKYNKLDNREWQLSRLAIYLNTRTKSKGLAGGFMIPAQSDSSMSGGVNMPITPIEHMLNIKGKLSLTDEKGNLTTIGKKLYNLAWQDIARMKQAKAYMFDSEGNLKPDLKLARYYHVDKEGNAFDANGKVTGRVFQFHTFYSLNDKNLFDSKGIIRDDITYYKEGTKPNEDILSAIKEWYRESAKTLTEDYAEYASMFDANMLRDFMPELNKRYNELSKEGDDQSRAIAKSIIDNKRSKLLTEFFINDYITQHEMSMFFYGVPAEYANDEDFNKRIKMLLAPSDRYSPEVMGEEIEILAVDDYKLSKGENVGAIIKYLGEVDPALADELVKMVEDSYKGIDVADGAAFCTTHEFVKRLEARGLLESYIDIFEKDDKGYWKVRDDIDYSKVRNIPQMMKPFSAGRQYDKETNLMRSFQTKYALFWLDKNFTIKSNGNTTELDKIRVGLEANRNISEMPMLSACKVGVTHHIPIAKDGRVNPDLFTLGKTEKRKTKYSGDQLTNPDHLEDLDIKLGVQISKLILTDILDDNYYIHKGKKIKGSELKHKYADVLGTIIKQDYESIVDELGIFNGHANNAILSEKFKEIGRARGFTEAEIEAVTATSYVTKRDGEGNAINIKVDGENTGELEEVTSSFNYPLFIETFKARTTRIIGSIFKNGVIDTKIKGAQVIAMPSLFYYVVNEHNDIIEDSKLKLIEEDGKLIMEVAMPAWSKKLYKDGKLMDMKDIPNELKEFIVYRIPTSGKHSAIHVRVKEFLPRSMGSTIILPAESISKTGHDFDIDKFFAHIKDFYNKDGVPTTYKMLDEYSSKDDIRESLKVKKQTLNSNRKEFRDLIYNYAKKSNIKLSKGILHNIKLFKDIDKALLDSENSNAALNGVMAKYKDEGYTKSELDLIIKGARSYLIQKQEIANKAIESQVDEIYDRLQSKDYSDNSRQALSNEIIDIMFTLLNSKNHAVENTFPDQFEQSKEARNKANALLEEGKKKKHELFTMFTQDELRAKAMASKNLVGPAANFNTAFSVINEVMNYKYNVDYKGLPRSIVVGQLVSHVVDAVKFALQTNLTDDTKNYFNYLVGFHKESLDFASMFLIHPIILKYSEEFARTNSFGKTSNYPIMKGILRDKVNEYVAKYGEEEGMDADTVKRASEGKLRVNKNTINDLVKNIVEIEDGKIVVKEFVSQDIIDRYTNTEMSEQDKLKSDIQFIFYATDLMNTAEKTSYDIQKLSMDKVNPMDAIETVLSIRNEVDHKSLIYQVYKENKYPLLANYFNFAVDPATTVIQNLYPEYSEEVLNLVSKMSKYANTSKDKLRNIINGHIIKSILFDAATDGVLPRIDTFEFKQNLNGITNKVVDDINVDIDTFKTLSLVNQIDILQRKMNIFDNPYHILGIIRTKKKGAINTSLSRDTTDIEYYTLVKDKLSTYQKNDIIHSVDELSKDDFGRAFIESLVYYSLLNDNLGMSKNSLIWAVRPSLMNNILKVDKLVTLEKYQAKIADISQMEQDILLSNIRMIPTVANQINKYGNRIPNTIDWTNIKDGYLTAGVRDNLNFQSAIQSELPVVKIEVGNKFKILINESTDDNVIFRLAAETDNSSRFGRIVTKYNSELPAEIEDNYNKEVNDKIAKELTDRFKTVGIRVKVVYDGSIGVPAHVEYTGERSAIIRLNPNKAGYESTFHEFGHILVDILGQDSELVREGKELAKDTQLYNDLKAIKPDWTEEQILNEVLVAAIGKRAAIQFNTKENESKFKSWIRRVMRAIGNFIYAITGGSFGTKEDAIEKLTKLLTVDNLPTEIRKLTPEVMYNDETDRVALIKMLDQMAEVKNSDKIRIVVVNGVSMYEVKTDKGPILMTRVNSLMEPYVNFDKEQAIELAIKSPVNLERIAMLHPIYIVDPIKFFNTDEGKVLAKKYLQTLWDMQTDYGTDVHAAIEKYLKTGEVTELLPANIKKYIDRRRAAGSTFYSEFTVFNEKLKVAGTIDLLEVTAKGKIVIHDFKTKFLDKWKKYDKSLEIDSKTLKLGGVLGELDNTPQNRYSVVMTIYKQLLGSQLGSLDNIYLGSVLPIGYSIDAEFGVPEFKLDHTMKDVGFQVIEYDYQAAKVLGIAKENAETEMADELAKELTNPTMSAEVRSLLNILRIHEKDQAKIEQAKEMLAIINEKIRHYNIIAKDVTGTYTKEAKARYKEAAKKIEKSLSDAAIAKDAHSVFVAITEMLFNDLITLGQIESKTQEYYNLFINRQLDMSKMTIREALKFAQDIDNIRKFIDTIQIIDNIKISNDYPIIKDLEAYSQEVRGNYDTILTLMKSMSSEMLGRLSDVSHQYKTLQKVISQYILDRDTDPRGREIAEDYLNAFPDISNVQLLLESMMDVDNKVLSLTAKNYEIVKDSFDNERKDMIIKFNKLVNSLPVDKKSQSALESYFKRFSNDDGTFITMYDNDKFNKAKAEAFKELYKSNKGGAALLASKKKAWLRENTDTVDEVTIEKDKADMKDKLDNGKITEAEYNDWYQRNFYYTMDPTKPSKMEGFPRPFGDYCKPTKEYYNSRYQALTKVEQEFLIGTKELITKAAEHKEHSLVSYGYLPPVGVKLQNDKNLYYKSSNNTEYEDGLGLTDIDTETIDMIPFIYNGTLNQMPLIEYRRKSHFETDAEYAQAIVAEVNLNYASSIKKLGKEPFKTIDEIKKVNAEIEKRNKERHAESVSYDLSKTVPIFIEAAMDHKFRTEVSSMNKLMLTALKQGKRLQRGRDGKFMKDLNSLKWTENVSRRAMDYITSSGNDSNSVKRLRAFIDMVQNGNFVKYEGKWTEIAKRIKQYNSLKGIGFNIFSATKNVMYGYTMMAIEGLTGQYYSKRDAKDAAKFYFGGTMSYFSDCNLIDGTASTLQSALIRDYNIVESQIEFQTGKKEKTYTGQYAWKMMYNAAFILQEIGEHSMQNQVLFTMLHSHRIVDGNIMSEMDYVIKKTDSMPTKTVSDIRAKKDAEKAAIKEFQSYTKLVDAYELRDGFSKIKEGITINKDQLSEFKIRVRGVNHMCHGIYNPTDKGTVEHIMIGQLAMQFRQWMRAGWTKRFRSNRTYRWDQRKKTQVVGSYSALWKLFTMPFRKDYNENLTPQQAQAMGTVQAILNGYADLILHAKLNWHKLNVYERAAARRGFFGGLMFLNALLLYGLLRGAAGDDDDSFFYNFAVYLTDAYKTEMSTYIPIWGWINEGSKVTMNPMATWGTATTAAKLFKDLINWPFDFDDEDYFQGGAYNDQLKAKIHLVQLVPGLSMAYRVVNLSESNRYYKLFTL